MQPMLGLLCYDCQSTGTSDKYYLKKYVLQLNVLNYYNLGLYKQNLNLRDIRNSMFHRAFFNSIIDKHQHMHFFTFKTVLV